MNTPLDRRRFISRAIVASTVAATASSGISLIGEDKKTLRIGLLSAGSYGASYTGTPQPRTRGSHHGTAFATTFNGFDEEKAKAFTGTFVRATKHIDGAKVVKVWDPNRDDAAALADVCSIPTVADSPEACIQDVDLALIVDDGSGEQWKYAEAALRAGVPTFCDKPLAMNAKDAAKIASIAKETGTKFMSASSLRFIPDVLQMKEDMQKLGKIRLCTVTGPGDLIYYGIHALSMAYALLGPGVISAHNVGRENGNIVRLRHQSDLDILLIVGAREYMNAGFSIQLHGEKGSLRVEPSLKDLYTYLLENFLDLVLHDKVTVPIDEEVEVIAALEAGRVSLDTGKEVLLKEVM